MVMKWLVPESSGRYVNRMTNEALHKGRECPSWAGHLISPWIPGMLDVRSAMGCEWQPAMAGEAGGESLGNCLLGHELATVLDKWIMSARAYPLQGAH